jgi:hypothetical protein
VLLGRGGSRAAETGSRGRACKARAEGCEEGQEVKKGEEEREEEGKKGEKGTCMQILGGEHADGAI